MCRINVERGIKTSAGEVKHANYRLRLNTCTLRVRSWRYVSILARIEDISILTYLYLEYEERKGKVTGNSLMNLTSDLRSAFYDKNRDSSRA